MALQPMDPSMGNKINIEIKFGLSLNLCILMALSCRESSRAQCFLLYEDLRKKSSMHLMKWL